MKRSKRAAKPQTRKKAAAAPAPLAEVNRRQMFGKMGKTVLGIAVVGGGIGLLLTRTVRAELHEHDLGRIGKGVPIIVQVHDPMCPDCVILQKQARAALGAFDEADLHYVIADLAKPEGRALALTHGVGKTTLLLFDGEGTRRGIVRGVVDSARLKKAFRELVDRAPGA